MIFCFGAGGPVWPGMGGDATSRSESVQFIRAPARLTAFGRCGFVCSPSLGQPRKGRYAATLIPSERLG